MERFCVITNVDKDQNYETAEFIRSYLETKGKECILARDRFADRHGSRYVRTEEISRDVECMIVLGGDGTMIQAARDFHHLEIPLLGVNLGTLGFLTDVEKQDIEASLDELFLNHYRVENRVMLESEGYGKALNDFVITKDGGRRLIEIEVYSGEEFVDTYVADGLILSTPTGSTGYNLSAGGPVLAPQVEAMIITPICPHSLNKRSLVVSSSDRIRIKIGKTKEHMEDAAAVLVDGVEAGKLTTGDEISIHKARQGAKIVKLDGFNFYRRMRQKLNRDV